MTRNTCSIMPYSCVILETIEQWLIIFFQLLNWINLSHFLTVVTGRASSSVASCAAALGMRRGSSIPYTSGAALASSTLPARGDAILSDAALGAAHEKYRPDNMTTRRELEAHVNNSIDITVMCNTYPLQSSSRMKCQYVSQFFPDVFTQYDCISNISSKL